MNTLREKVDDFLSQKCIAVAGVSRNESPEAANIIYKKLKETGHTVYPVNPNAETVEGDPCYPDLKSTPNRVDGIVICTKPEVANDLVKQCAEIGIKRVWMHRSFGQGSVSEEAADFCHQQDITVIAGACPMMYCQPVDFGHKCMRWVLGVFGILPK
jgi:predicted CoA-binding protein